MRLLLASGSPRRAELLAAAGFAFEIARADVDETPSADEPATEYVVRLASEKSARVLEMLNGPGIAAGSSRLEDVAILGADTAVVVDGAILGKPRNDDEARDMLARLSNRSHQVMTGVSVRSATSELRRLAATSVWFSALSPETLAWYVDTGEGRDKAGAYAIQGRASRFIPRIDGSYSNVVGLPIALVFEMLAELTRSENPS